MRRYRRCPRDRGAATTCRARPTAAEHHVEPMRPDAVEHAALRITTAERRERTLGARDDSDELTGVAEPHYVFDKFRPRPYHLCEARALPSSRPRLYAGSAVGVSIGYFDGQRLLGSLHAATRARDAVLLCNPFGEEAARAIARFACSRPSSSASGTPRCASTTPGPATRAVTAPASPSPVGSPTSRSRPSASQVTGARGSRSSACDSALRSPRSRAQRSRRAAS